MLSNPLIFLRQNSQFTGLSTSQSVSQVNQCGCYLLLKIPLCLFYCGVALGVYNRSSSAYQALRHLKILQLPHSKTLKQIIKDDSEKAGIDDEYLYGQHNAYVKYHKEREEEGHLRPLGIRVMMWYKVKVRKLYQVTLSFKVNHSAISYMQKLTHAQLMGLPMVLQLVFCNKISSRLTVKLRKG